MNILVVAFVVLRQKGQERMRRGVAHGQQGGHVDPNQRLGLHPDEIRQRAVYPQNIAGFVVSDDEIADGIENLDPVAVGLVHAGKQAGIFQRHCGMSCDGLQHLLVVFRHGLLAISQAQHAHQFPGDAQQPHQGADRLPPSSEASAGA